MSRILVAIAFTFLAVLAVSAVVKSSSASNLYARSDLGYAVDSPGGWIPFVFSNEGHEDIAWLDSLASMNPEPGQPGFSRGARIWIGTYEYPSDLKLDEFVNSWAEDGLLKVTSFRHVDVSGVDSVLLDYEFENIKGSIVFTYYGGKLYQTGLAIHDFESFSSGEMTSYLNKFNGIVSSFNLKNR